MVPQDAPEQRRQSTQHPGTHFKRPQQQRRQSTGTQRRRTHVPDRDPRQDPLFVPTPDSEEKMRARIARDDELRRRRR